MHTAAFARTVQVDVARALQGEGELSGAADADVGRAVRDGPLQPRRGMFNPLNDCHQPKSSVGERTVGLYVPLIGQVMLAAFASS